MKKILHYYKVALYVWLRIFRKEVKDALPLSLAQRAFAWSRGFKSSSYILYRFDKNNPRDYLSDWAESFRGKFINTNTLFIDNKILFPQIAGPYVKMTDEPFILMQGQLIPLAKTRDIRSPEDLLDEIETKGPKIFKPVDGSSGEGIIKISSSGNNWHINQREATRHDCLVLLRSLDNYLVSEFIRQASYSNAIYPQSVNTVRLLTMIDPDTGKPFLAASAHRIGNHLSYPVDNCAAGGFTAFIDPETGVMGKAISTVVTAGELLWHSQHPDTNAPIEGVAIPGWENLKKVILEIAQSLFFIPYIGWDIVITDDGFTIIEANDEPDIKLHQVHAPLLKQERIRRFYNFHRVI